MNDESFVLSSLDLVTIFLDHIRREQNYGEEKLAMGNEKASVSAAACPRHAE